MALEFSLAHLTLLDSSPLEMVEIAQSTGYDFVSFRLTPVCKNEEVFPLATNAALRNKVKALLNDTGVRVLDIELARLGVKEEPEDYLKVMEAGADLGAKHLICQAPDHDHNRVVDRFSKLCELAKPFGLTVDLEFLPWSKMANLNDAAHILEQANADNAGILVDILHFARSASTLEQLSSLPKSWFHFMHLCDADKVIPKTTEGLIHTARSDRDFPGKGSINVKEIVNTLPQIPYSLEIPNDLLRQQLGNKEYARQALLAAKFCLQSEKFHHQIRQ